MKLSDLVTGQEAFITEIKGEGSIKKRIHEMGFIEGRKVKAIKAAPLKDPIEYDIMGYKITIRRKDAAMISVVTHQPVLNGHQKPGWFREWQARESPLPTTVSWKTRVDRKVINVALVGNPNCGKTTIFNFTTNSKERVANYAGVTVAAKEALVEIGGFSINIVDLPGTYSLSSYSPEEMFVTDYLLHNRPDVIVNVVDAGNLERNLFLTTQLVDSGITTIVALNMYDELQAGTNSLDHCKLGELMGVPFIPTVGVKGKGIKELFETVIQVFKGLNETVRQVDIPYGEEMERVIAEVGRELQAIPCVIPTSRLLTLQLLEAEPEALVGIPAEHREHVLALCAKKRKEIEGLVNRDLNMEIVSTRYGFIQGALAETYLREAVTELISPSQKIDQVLTHKIWGIPVFFGIIWFVFYCTFQLGQYPLGWIDGGVGALAAVARQLLPTGAINQLVADGVISGVGGVAVFLPNIMILFFLISVLEDSGYMARTAFLMDKVMHVAGLHGKSFIPLLMGFGCNVPAIMATRTIESRRDRMVTMFITPFMSCSARLPVYVLFISAFFPHFESLVLFSMYTIGILAALLTAIILNKTVFRKTESPFVMELPPYRLPTLKAVGKHTWFKTVHFLKKMGTIILLASVVLWALGYFPQDETIISNYDRSIENRQVIVSVAHPDEASMSEIKRDVARLEAAKKGALLEQSYISRIGKFIQPVFEPLGFDWRMSVSLLTGVLAKEVVVSSMGILYQVSPGDVDADGSLASRLRQSQQERQVSLITYFGFLVFTLLYFPCIGTLSAIKRETARYHWVLFSAVYPLVFAWVVTFVIVHLGRYL